MSSAKQALDLLRRAARARQVAGTALNQHSSRSHAVFTVKLLRRGCSCGDGEEGGDGGDACGGGSGREAGGGGEPGYLHFVDLAGCERVARTGNSGARLRWAVSGDSECLWGLRARAPLPIPL